MNKVCNSKQLFKCICSRFLYENCWTTWLQLSPWQSPHANTGSNAVWCLGKGSPLTCYCNVDFTRPGSELPILRKRWYAWSSQWLKAKGTVTGKVTEGWSSVNCLGSGEPFHIKCYIISTRQIWLQNISRLKKKSNHYKNKFIKKTLDV